MSPQEQAKRALDALDEVGDVEGRRIYDACLRAALEPLRATGLLQPFFCSKCEQRIAWWAIDPAGAFVIASERRLSTDHRHPGSQRLAGRGPRSNEGLAPWIESAMKPGGRIELVDHRTPGYPLRLKFRCRCGADYTTKNTQRLRAFLTATASRSSRIQF